VPVLFLRLEFELVNLVTPGEAEGRLQVLGEVVDLLDVGKESGINGLEREPMGRSLILCNTPHEDALPRLTFCSLFLSSDKSFFSLLSPKNWSSLPSFPAFDLVK
jgi:hypothetical protein